MAKQSNGPIGSDGGAGIGADGNEGAIGHVDTTAIPDAEPAKRGGWPKGKPRGNPGRNSGGDSGTGSASAGTRNARLRSEKEAASLDLSGISSALVGIHMGIAMLAKQPHWALEPSEADALAESVKNVARHYPAVAKSQKIVDWVMLIQAVGFAYAPRVMLSKELAKEKKNVAPMA